MALSKLSLLSPLKILTTKPRLLPPPSIRLPYFFTRKETATWLPHIHRNEPRRYDERKHPETPITRILTPIGFELKKIRFGFSPYSTLSTFAYMMNNCAIREDADGIFNLYEELKEKLGGEVSDGVVYGGLMKGYFLKGEEEEAMKMYDELMGDESRVRMHALDYNSVLEALCKNGKFDEALKLFDRMKDKHDPPRTISVNLGSYNVILDAYCAEGRFKEAVYVFMGMDEMRCSPDTLSINKLIEKLCDNGLLAEAEELCRRMEEKDASLDEVTYGLLMDACFKAERPVCAVGYFKRMIDEMHRVKLSFYSRFVHGLIKGGKVDELESHSDLVKTLCYAGKLPEVLDMVSKMIGYIGCDPCTILLLGFSMDEVINHWPIPTPTGREEQELWLIMNKEALMKLRYLFYPPGEEAMAEQNVNDHEFVNYLIEKLCDNGLLDEAEELCGSMWEKEVTYGLLMDACFKAERSVDAARYFKRIIDERLRLNLSVYSRFVDGLVKVGKVVEANFVKSYEFMFKELCDEFRNLKMGNLDELRKMVSEMIFVVGRDIGTVSVSYYGPMEEVIKDGLRKAGIEENEELKLVDRLKEKHNPPRTISVNRDSYNVSEADEAKMDALSYELMFIELCCVGKMDEVMKMVSDMLDDPSMELNSDMEEIIKNGLRKAGREEEELSRLIEQKLEANRIAEEVERTKTRARARAAVLKRLCYKGKLDELMKMGSGLLDDASVELNSDLEEIIKGGQRRGGAAEAY